MHICHCLNAWKLGQVEPLHAPHPWKLKHFESSHAQSPGNEDMLSPCNAQKTPGFYSFLSPGMHRPLEFSTSFSALACAKSLDFTRTFWQALNSLGLNCLKRAQADCLKLPENCLKLPEKAATRYTKKACLISGHVRPRKFLKAKTPPKMLGLAVPGMLFCFSWEYSNHREN